MSTPATSRTHALPKCLACWALGAALAVLLLSPSSAAQNASQRQLSDYEEESIRIALKQVRAQREPNPDGKRIEGIEIVTLEVFEPRDPLPGFVNVFHATTRDYIIEREVLLSPGDHYNQKLIDETERNLRAFAQLSVVLLIPIRGSTPETVRLLVITKDVWSLRISWEPQFYNGKITSLTLSPSETNIFGTHQIATLNLGLTANTYSLGASYFVPRIGGSRVHAYLSGSVRFNCLSHRQEGGSGYFEYGQPLYSSLARWSWRVAASWYDLVQREFAGGHSICSGGTSRQVTLSDPVAEYDTIPAQRLAPSSSARAGRPGMHGVALRDRRVRIPYQYREERHRAQFALTRSWFRENKLNLSLGLEADRRSFSETEMSPEELEAFVVLQTRWSGEPLRYQGSAVPVQESDVPIAQRLFRANLADSDLRVSPYIQLHAFRNRFLRTINYNTLGLQEDVQIGHNVWLRLYPAFRPLSYRNMLGVFASAGYTWPWYTGFVRLLGAATIEYAGPGNRSPEQETRNRSRSFTYQSDAEVTLAAYVASPDLGLGRLVSSARLIHRPLQYLQFFVGLGGTDRLRGYEPASFIGQGVLSVNTEFRTRPLQLYSVLAGLAAFWDAGDAFNDLRALETRHSVGVGLRLLFPQLDRDVFRFDVAWPLRDGSGATFTAGFEQAFDAPAAYPPALLYE